MSAADCDIGLLEAFLCAEEGDGGAPAPAPPGTGDAEERDVRWLSAAVDSTERSSSSTLPAPLHDGKAAVNIPAAESPKAAAGTSQPAEKKQFSRQFMKSRESHLMHKGDTDSSDDEDNRYFEQQNYSDYGRSVKHLLNKSSCPAADGGSHCGSPGAPCKTSQPLASLGAVPSLSAQAKTSTKPSLGTTQVDEDPVFGIRIVNPLISSLTLKERMVDRQVVPLASLKRHLAREDHPHDWVIGGVVVSKSGARTSQKGAEYTILRISDLKAGLKTASVFLFGRSFKELWKTSVGTVLGILNPKPLDNRGGSGDEAAVSVDNPQKVMIMGTSKDFGMCKARKKNGDSCTSFVNLRECEYCVFHLQKAYKSCSRRMELQSPCAGGRGLDRLRNKVLGKNEVFYGGQSFMAVPAKKSRKLASKDNERLKKLSDFYRPEGSGACPSGQGSAGSNGRSKYISTLLEKSSGQAHKDQERLRKLSLLGSSENTDPNVTKTAADKVQTRLVVEKTVPTASQPQMTAKLSMEIPQLGRGVADSGIVDLTPPRTLVHRERAKLNALKWIHKNGPIRKEDPNKVPGTDKDKNKLKREGDENVNATKHMRMEALNASSSPAAGTKAASPAASAGVSLRFQKLLEATSRHMELIEARDNEAQEEYFDRLVKKEQLEDKMLSTYKVPCKAVKCLKCKYTAFSASERCKAEGHPLRVTDGTKRFFKCGDCGGRTACLELVPLWSCKNCAGSQWQRAPMIKERKVGLTTPLSIRGDEEMYIGSVQSDGNLSLLVPE